MIHVIGSGPAGVACASALLDRGLEVTLLDAGARLEPERSARVDALARGRPGDWSEAALAALRGAPPTLGGVQLKYAYGSDFPYREVERHVPFENRGSATRPTLARGGFSTVWGAALLPYRDEDLADWPLSAADLAAHYRAVLSLLPFSAVRDGLAEMLPLHAESPSPLRPSAQAADLLHDLARAATSLRRDGIRFGQARLAVRADADASGPGCAYCGLCLHGCPYRLIYDASTTLAALRRRENFRYVDDVIVERLEESGTRVRILARSRTSGAPLRFEASRVYVGCGVVSTTRLLLASLDAYDRPLELQDSLYFLLPWLRVRARPDVTREALHTLAQVFVEVCGEDDPRTVHLQVYSYNDHYRAAIDARLGRLARLVRRPADALLGRLLLIQGYLHSRLSPTIAATLRRDGAAAKLVLEARPLGSESKRALRRVTRLLLRHARDFRALPARPLMRVAPPGRGFHTGGAFPMRRLPGPFESDPLGRPHGFSRVHVIDAAAFPSVPATTITLSVMANAHRIGSADPDT